MSSQARVTQAKQPKQASLASWLQKLQRPPYPKAPPLPAEFAAHANNRPQISLLDATNDRSSISPPATRQRASSPVAQPPKAMPATSRSSAKRKRGLSEVANSPASPLAFRPSPLKPKAEVDVHYGDPRSSGLSMASHTPPEPSSPTSPMTGLTQKKPINITSSSPRIFASQNRSFVVQSSQSDERVESEEDHESDTIVLQSSRTKDEPATRVESLTSSDGEHTDSDLESLPDMATILKNKIQAKAKKLQKEQRPLTPPTTGTGGRNKRGTTFKGSYNVPQTFETILSKPNKSDDSPLQTTSIAPKHKINLSKLVKLAQKDERRVSAMHEADAAMLEQEEEDSSNGETDSRINILANLREAGGEEDDLERLTHAMDRTEVMKGNTEWYFFNHGTVEVDEHIPDFPSLESETSDWAFLQDEAAREHAFLTGFIPEIVQPQSLSVKSKEQFMSCLWSAASLEPKEDLAHAYITVLKVWRSAEPLLTRSSSTPIKAMFQRSGARSMSLTEQQAMQPPFNMKSTIPLSRSKHLLRSLDLMTQLPEAFDMTGIQYAIIILAKLGADSAVTQRDVEVQVALQGAFTALFQRLDEAKTGHVVLRDISKILFDACKVAPIQERLISMLPATTPRLAHFRRQLALAFFLASPEPLYTDLHSNPQAASIHNAILERLENSGVFELDDDTDFAELTALISILDIGIGPGFSSEPNLLSQPRPPPVISAKVSRFNRVTKEVPSDPVTLAQTAHNAAVDRLSDALKGIASCIHDRGASHMGRTETKGVLERVIQRLQLSVRCWPRKRGGRGDWLSDLPPTNRLAQGLPRGLDDFIKVEKGEKPADNILSEPKHTLDAETTGIKPLAAATSFGEDEFEVRAGITA